jgi:hypothetical protein
LEGLTTCVSPPNQSRNRQEAVFRHEAFDRRLTGTTRVQEGSPTMFFLLKKWLGRPLSQRPDLHFLVYTRAGCHLCEDTWDLLVAQQKLRGFALEKTDLDTHPDLVAQFGDCVPVVMVNGKVRFRGRINDVLLQRILDARVNR